MNDRSFEPNPVLFINGSSEEDREAFRLLESSGLAYSLSGPTSEESTPLLIANFRRLQGIDAIKRYVESRKKNIGE